MITSSQKQFLKSLAHPMKPVVQIGKDHLTDGLIQEVGRALNDHELIKIKLLRSATETQVELVTQLCQKLDAVCVEQRGHVATLYRARAENPRIVLPKS
jgi:RNA-binding protein